MMKIISLFLLFYFFGLSFFFFILVSPPLSLVYLSSCQPTRNAIVLSSLSSIAASQEVASSPTFLLDPSYARPLLVVNSRGPHAPCCWTYAHAASQAHAIILAPCRCTRGPHRACASPHHRARAASPTGAGAEESGPARCQWELEEAAYFSFTMPLSYICLSGICAAPCEERLHFSSFGRERWKTASEAVQESIPKGP